MSKANLFNAVGIKELLSLKNKVRLRTGSPDAELIRALLFGKMETKSRKVTMLNFSFRLCLAAFCSLNYLVSVQAVEPVWYKYSSVLKIILLSLLSKIKFF